MAENITKEVLNKIILGGDSSSLLSNLPPEITSNLTGLINLFKILGIVFLVYILFRIIILFFDIRRNIRISKTYHTVNEINKKLDMLLGRKGIKTEKQLQGKSKK